MPGHLNWESHWCREEDFDAHGNWLGLPRKEFQEIKLNYGTCNKNLRKANTNILPANTVILDLTQDETTILNRMKPKTRYNIRLAIRKGINVVSAGMDILSSSVNLYLPVAISRSSYQHKSSFQNLCLTVFCPIDSLLLGLAKCQLFSVQVT